MGLADGLAWDKDFPEYKVYKEPKPYFLKYVPIEGEVKEGDAVKLKSQLERFPDNSFTVYEKEQGSGKFMLRPFRFTDEQWKNHIWENEMRIKDSQCTTDKLQKVKLFLCSRDIQVGDKIIADYIIDGTSEGLGMNHIQKEGIVNKEEFGDHWGLTTKLGREYARKDGCLKVIGEISPDALDYVKEGDEFDETQLALGTGDNSYPFIEIPSVWDIKPERWKEYPIKVKGPCGHFH